MELRLTGDLSIVLCRPKRLKRWHEWCGLRCPFSQLGAQPRDRCLTLAEQLLDLQAALQHRARGDDGAQGPVLIGGRLPRQTQMVAHSPG